MTQYYIAQSYRQRVAMLSDIEHLYDAMDAAEDIQATLPRTKDLYEVFVRIYHALDQVFKEGGYKSYLQRLSTSFSTH